MANHKKTVEQKLQPCINMMRLAMIGKLDSIAIDNDISRNEVVRRACEFLLKNPKKFNLINK